MIKLWYSRDKVGSELDLYDVQTTYPNESVDTYIPFLGELRDGLYFHPSDSAKEMMDKVADMVWLLISLLPRIRGLTVL